MFPWQQWLCVCATMLCDAYTAYLVVLAVDLTCL